METINIEAAVRRALTAYKAEDGVANQATAAAWAEQHLTDGVQVFTDGLNSEPVPGAMPVEAAFAQLKAWAATKL
jgi:hypothetical protein